MIPHLKSNSAYLSKYPHHPLNNRPLSSTKHTNDPVEQNINRVKAHLALDLHTLIDKFKFCPVCISNPIPNHSLYPSSYSSPPAIRNSLFNGHFSWSPATLLHLISSIPLNHTLFLSCHPDPSNHRQDALDCIPIPSKTTLLCQLMHLLCSSTNPPPRVAFYSVDIGIHHQRQQHR